VDGLSMELDNSQKETRNSSSELFRIKNAYEESIYIHSITIIEVK
jgi:hypothetical protein